MLCREYKSRQVRAQYGPFITYEQLLRAYPQYTSLQITTVNQGTSAQHMVSLTAQKRFSRGMQLLATYTRSKMYEATSKPNPSDTELERRIANEDRPNRFVLSGVYALPFGARRRSGVGSPQRRPRLQHRGVQHRAGKLDRNIRTLPSDFGELRLDAINTLNVALVKNTSLAKGVTLQLRAETFNAFDRVQFSAPVNAPTNANFGLITSQANAPRSVQFAVRLMW